MQKWWAKSLVLHITKYDPPRQSIFFVVEVGLISMTYQNKHSSNPLVENLNLPKVKLIKSYKANSHLNVETSTSPRSSSSPATLQTPISPRKT